MKLITSVSAIGLVVAAGLYWYVYGETIRPYSTMELGRMLTGTYVE